MKRTIIGIALAFISLIGFVFLVSWAAFYESLVFSVWWRFPILITIGFILLILGIIGGVILYDDLY